MTGAASTGSSLMFLHRTNVCIVPSAARSLFSTYSTSIAIGTRGAAQRLSPSPPRRCVLPSCFESKRLRTAAVPGRALRDTKKKAISAIVVKNATRHRARMISSCWSYIYIYSYTPKHCTLSRYEGGVEQQREATNNAFLRREGNRGALRLRSGPWQTSARRARGKAPWRHRKPSPASRPCGSCPMRPPRRASRPNRFRRTPVRC